MPHPIQYTTQAHIRRAFWADHPAHKALARERGTLSKGQNAQTADCRMAFCDFIQQLEASGEISAALADRATL